jgi:hypothetical protein
MDGVVIRIYVRVCDPTQKGAFRGVCELVKVTHVSPQYMCVCGINVGKKIKERKIHGQGW